MSYLSPLFIAHLSLKLDSYVQINETLGSYLNIFFMNS